MDNPANKDEPKEEISPEQLNKYSQQRAKGLRHIGIAFVGFAAFMMGLGFYVNWVTKSIDHRRDYRGRIGTAEVERFQFRDIDWPFSGPWNTLKIKNNDGSKREFVDNQPFGSLDYVLAEDAQGSTYCFGEADFGASGGLCTKTGVPPQYQREFEQWNKTIDEKLGL